MRRYNLLRILVVLLPLIWFAIGPPAPLAQRQEKGDVFEKSIQPFFSDTCYMCHNSQLKSGGLDLESFKTAESIIENRETWEHVLQKMQSGEMPPKGVPRPDEASLKAAIQWLENQFARADRLAKPDPGRVTARRLNRAEYNNTVRDLLGVDLRPADDFPQDDSGYGFDNIGDVLSLSPVLMEKYLAAAEKVARTAIFGQEQLKPTLVQYRLPGRRIIPTRTPPADYDLTGLTLPNTFHVTHRFPVDGEYVVRAFTGGSRPAGSEPIDIGLWVDGRLVQEAELDPDKTASFDDNNQEFGGKVQDLRTRITAGDHLISASLLRLYEGLPPRYNGPNPSKRIPPSPREFKMRPGIPPERVAEIKKRFEARRAEAKKIPINEARVSYIEIGGPYNQPKGPSQESLKKIYVCGHLDGKHQTGCDRKIVADLARRAYRRPVATEEVDKLLSLVSLATKRGDSLEEGLCLSLQAMLVSPDFLFRIERNRLAAKAAGAASIKVASVKTADIDGVQRINDHELAARLSYFIWSSMPDDELMRLADRGLLRRPAVLSAQVRRMLKDPKSRALVENFGGQWLELRKLESIKPDRERFPEFDEYLRQSMRRETERFIETIVREDRSILDFIDGRYSFLNERMAKFYKVPGVTGPEFRKVLLTGNTQRSGILTQASVLTVSSYTTRTSPVLRGKWILENILNAPPPPPPPGVPNLDEAKIGSSATLRQQLEEHRNNATCASCHARMDPLGFGLENFDAIGAWRTQDGKFPVDTSGQLPDGRSFQGPEELKAILRADREAFAECLTEKLLTYGLGRGLERYDRPVVKKIARSVAVNNYRFSSLVLEIAKSMPFQMRRL
jgi:cytochrome c5